MILQQAQLMDLLPKRIVSLVPSQTELLYYLGLQEETAGITKFCIHPKTWRTSKTIVGGTKTLHLSAIKKLQPDLIIANKEENVKAQIEELAADCNVMVTDVNNTAEALQMIRDIGNITGKANEAERLATAIATAFKNIQQHASAIPAAYLIWNKPYMTVGGDTFISDMMTKAGLVNVFEHQTRYPEISIADLQASGCRLVLLSSEPYPFKQQHVVELQQQLPGIKIVLTDGEMFSWYGSRMLLAAEYLQNVRREW
jgi:ABC-type Fe3+-hydroxamate transport system substrate-binding protein